MCGLGLYVAQRVVAFGFEDEVTLGVAIQANDEVGDVVVRLAVVKIRDGEAEAGVLDERMDARIRVYMVGGRLLPSHGVGDGPDSGDSRQGLGRLRMASASATSRPLASMRSRSSSGVRVSSLFLAFGLTALRS